MKKKATIGRPPKKPADKLNAKFLLQMTDAEKAAHKAKADAANVSLTTWIRRTLNRAKR